MVLGEDYPETAQCACGRSARAFPANTGASSTTAAAYPTEFVTELTEAGFLGALIPEEYGGSGLPLRAAAVILEEINASGCTASQRHAQMYIMGTLLRHGSEEQKQRYLPEIAAGESAAAGLRRHRADHRLRHHPAEDPRGARRRSSMSSTARRSGPRARCTPT